MFAAVRSNRGVQIAAIVLVVLALSVGGYLLLARRAEAAPQQPIPFNHQVMVQAGTPCLYCHADAIRSPTAGIPSVEKCLGCHRVIATQNPDVQAVAEYFQRGEPIPWTRLSNMPRFVYFSHRVHVAAGLNCERCHGDVGNMTETRAVVDMTMGWCLGCHEEQPNADQLRGCLVCHK